MMWLFMSRHARAQGGKTGLTLAGGAVLAQPAWAGEYCISTGVSGRSVNQHRTLASLTNMGQIRPLLTKLRRQSRCRQGRFRPHSRKGYGQNGTRRLQDRTRHAQD
jgi:hypothetical protein